MQGGRYTHSLVLLVTAAASLALTGIAWQSGRLEAAREAQGQFDSRSAEIATAIQGRMLDYEQVLRGAVGLFAASAQVAREEWSAYVRTIQIERAYPGIQGFGFAPYVRREGRSDIERAARRDGIAAYRVFPLGDRDVHAPVLYLLPLSERNQRALGFDMYSEPVRRKAMQRARDAGVAAITGAVTLVQESGADTQVGFLMYLPVYRNGAPASTVAQRRSALAGYVFSPFRTRDLMAGIMGSEPGIEVRVTDVTDAASPEALFHGTPGSAGTRRAPPRFTMTATFAVQERNWRLDTASLPSLEADMASNRPPLILASGLAISTLLVLIVWSLLTTRERARALAHSMTSALRASEERLQLALANSNLALFDWNLATGLVHLSREWSQMLGGAAEPTILPIQRLEALVHPDDAPAVQAEVSKLLKGESETYRVEQRVRTRDGGWKWIESLAKVSERDAAGRALRVTGTNADIEERKAIERLKNEFIATVSHELRTPLTSMLASLALVREGSAGELPATARNFVEIAYSNTERLTALVNDILEIERAEAGQLELEIKDVELAALLRRAIELNAPYAERYRAKLALDIPAAIPHVRADADRLLQVLTNLLSNAAKHSPPDAEVTLRAQAATGTVRVSVSDRGSGIPPEFRARLFGKFEQADRTRGGTGLGLAISKELVERMQGRIGCDSMPGQGSTFWIELPAA